MLLVLFFIILCGHVTRSENETPYTVEIDNFQVSTEYDQKFVNWDTLGLKQKGRNEFVIGGTLYINRNLAEEQKINIQVFNYDKERHIKGPLVFIMQIDICEFISTNEDIYPGLLKKSNLPDSGTCPIPKNEYRIEDYEMTADFLPDDIPRGDYLLVFLLKDHLNPVAGFTVTITITD